MTDMNLESWVKTNKVNFGKRSMDYARFRPGPPTSFFERLSRDWMPMKGARVLDLGTGPGVAAFEMGQLGAQVVGVDIAHEQIEAARMLAAEKGLTEQCSFHVGSAEDTKQPANSFDLVTAVQCWPWFNDKLALKEIARVLKPNGILAIVQNCYHQDDPIVRLTENLILEFNPTWNLVNFDGLYPRQVRQVEEGGFDLLEQFCYNYDQPFTAESWRGRIRTCNGIGSGTLSETKVEEFDGRLYEKLQTDFPSASFLIRHRLWCVLARAVRTRIG